MVVAAVEGKEASSQLQHSIHLHPFPTLVPPAAVSLTYLPQLRLRTLLRCTPSLPPLLLTHIAGASALSAIFLGTAGVKAPRAGVEEAVVECRSRRGELVEFQKQLLG